MRISTTFSIIAAVATSLLASLAFADDKQSFPGIEKLMSEQEFLEAGLTKLNDAERAKLNEWLLNYTALDAQTMRRTNEEVKTVVQAQTITAKVVPEFKGWSGKTVFTLDNGQVWRQRQSGRLLYSGGSTAVTLSRNFLGFWVLKHEATGRSVGVSRIE